MNEIEKKEDRKETKEPKEVEEFVPRVLPSIQIRKKKIIEASVVEEIAIFVESECSVDCLHTIYCLDPTLIKDRKMRSKLASLSLDGIK